MNIHHMAMMLASMANPAYKCKSVPKPRREDTTKPGHGKRECERRVRQGKGRGTIVNGKISD